MLGPTPTILPRRLHQRVRVHPDSRQTRDIELLPPPLPDVVAWHHAWLDAAAADRLQVHLRDEVEWEQHDITLFGRTSPVPRLSRWFGEHDYTYSGARNVATPFTAELASLNDRLIGETGVPFNSILANRYRTGADTVGWHADDEPELGDPLRSTIATVVVGEARDFVLRHTASGETWTVPAAHGDLVLMRPGCQAHYRHAVPRRARVRAERFSLTFREFMPFDR